MSSDPTTYDIIVQIGLSPSRLLLLRSLAFTQGRTAVKGLRPSKDPKTMLDGCPRDHSGRIRAETVFRLATPGASCATIGQVQ